MSTAVCGFRRYDLPQFGSSKAMVPRTASYRLICPSTTLAQVGERLSSQSAMNTLAPEFRALMIILRSVGPVISTRRSCKSAGSDATVQSDSRIDCVLRGKVGSSPASNWAWRASRTRNSSRRRALNARQYYYAPGGKNFSIYHYAPGVIDL